MMFIFVLISAGLELLPKNCGRISTVADTCSSFLQGHAGEWNFTKP
jgi:hypothetical protein